MPLPISDFAVLQNYADGVMNRSDHHAKAVGGIALALLGALLWKGDSASLKAYGNAGPMGNVLWVSISGKQYAFSYDHDAGEIIMREGSTRGSEVRRFDNLTPVTDVEAFFRGL